jgi:PAS domain S-box-containing protein
MFGYSRENLQSMAVEMLVPAGLRAQHAEQRADYAQQPERRPMGSGRHLRACRADGTMFDVDIMLSPLESAAGVLTIAIVLDVTALHRQQERIESALREKETLLKEIYHRVKNNLQVIASMISLQERAVSDSITRVALKEAADRVRAMALVHEKLYQSGDLSSIALDGYIAELCTQLGNGAAAAERGITLETQAEAMQIGLDMAVPLGLVLNELLSNCLKHAFPDGRRGRIVVRLEVQEGTLIGLSVTDDGVGLPAGFALGSARSLGLKLVAALARQLDGELTLVSQHGTVATLTLRRNGREPT